MEHFVDRWRLPGLPRPHLGEQLGLLLAAGEILTPAFEYIEADSLNDVVHAAAGAVFKALAWLHVGARVAGSVPHGPALAPIVRSGRDQIGGHAAIERRIGLGALFHRKGDRLV